MTTTTTLAPLTAGEAAIGFGIIFTIIFVIIAVIIFAIVRSSRKSKERSRIVELNRRAKAKRHAERLVTQGNAVDDAMRWMNSKRRQATVYVTGFDVDGQTYSKVGISKNTDGKRVRQHTNNGHKVFETWAVPSVAVARAVEREILDWSHATTGFSGKNDAEHLAHLLPQGGYTELTIIDPYILSAVVGRMVHHYTTEAATL